MDVESGSTQSGSTKKHRLTPTRLFLRGLAISLPPILTLVILIWIGRGVHTYIIYPASTTVRYVIAQVIDDSIPINSKDPQLVRLPNGPPLDFVDRDYLVTNILKRQFDLMTEDASRGSANQGNGDDEARNSEDTSQDGPSDQPETAPISDKPTATLTGPQLLDVMQKEERYRSEWLAKQAAYDKVENPAPEVYVPLDRAVPFYVYENVAKRVPASEMPTTATGIYMDYAAERYFGSQFLLSAAAVTLIVVLLYFLGRFVNVRIGGWMVNKVETDLLGRLPVVRNVYGSAKQVTDFLFSENQVEYRRVVAIEYPRRGIWSLGLVTGESMLEITAAVGEPCVSVLIPSSPMPVTGYTMCVPRSTVLDLDITVDQAFQFCISCGVLVPPNQRVTPELLQRELTRRLTERMQESGTERRVPPSPGANSSGADRSGADPADVSPPPTDPASPSEEGETPEPDPS